MISDISKYVSFLTENNISEHQFLILWLVYTKDADNIAKYRKKKTFNLEELEDLIDRGWIDDFGLIKDNIRTYNIVDFVVTDTFTKVVVVDEDDAYEELCKVYPKWFNIKGKKVPAITGDPMKIAKLYWQCHKGNRIEHQRIVRITELYHKNKDPMEKMENYILNKRWNLIEEETGGNTGFDAFRTL